MSEWLQVKSLEMLVSKSELNLDINKNSDVLLFSCDLLNIARGRCDLVLKKTLNSSISYISINMDKPVMVGEINFSNVFSYFCLLTIVDLHKFEFFLKKSTISPFILIRA